jgi:hypothetical protein
MDADAPLARELREIQSALKTASGNERFKLLTRMDDILADPQVRAWWDEACGVVGPVEGCGHPAAFAFSFVCPRSWEGLATTDSPNERTCDLCRERVYLVDSDEALIEHTEQKHCIALPIVYERSRLEEAHRAVSFVGRPRPIDYIKAYVRQKSE